MAFTKIFHSLFLSQANRKALRFLTSDIKGTQETILRSILKLQEHTEWGQKHEFEAIKDAKHFQKKVPLTDYDDLFLSCLKTHHFRTSAILSKNPPLYFAETSGTTTGASKLIPISQEQLEGSKKASLLLLQFNLLRTKDPSLLFKKKIWMVDPVKPKMGVSGLPQASISSIARHELPLIARRSFIPQKPLPARDKMKSIVDEARGQKIVAISGMNTWLLSLCRELEAHGESIKSLWPETKIIHYGGTPFEPYRKLFEKYLSGLKLVETYAASEGFFGMQSLEDDGLIFFSDHGIFYEFEDLATGDVLCLWEVETGKEYGLVVTNFSGLYRYRVGDKILFHKLCPKPTFQVTGRIADRLDFFNEHVLVSEVEKALGETFEGQLGEWCVGSDVDHKQHVLFLELDSATNVRENVSAFDERLKELNAYYRKYRQDDSLMHRPRVSTCAPGTLNLWLAQEREFSLQLKIPRILNPERQKRLEIFLDQRPS